MNIRSNGRERRKALGALALMQDFERLSVKIYQVQAGASGSKQVSDTLKLLMGNEAEHVDNLGRRLAELGGAISKARVLFAVAGELAGLFTALLGKNLILKADIWIEKRAVRGYERFLKSADFDTESDSVIRSNIADEVIHIQKLRKLQLDFRYKRAK